MFPGLSHARNVDVEGSAGMYLVTHHVLECPLSLLALRQDCSFCARLLAPSVFGFSRAVSGFRFVGPLLQQRTGPMIRAEPNQSEAE